jgi:tetratricopeptide (TPR) repeat protein
MTSAGSSKRFRIAFSFAGEKREFVGKVARLLADQFGEPAILYDKFHEAEFASADLAFDLPALYKNESEVIVAVFCRDYDRKEWCGLEWRAIFSIIKEGAKQQVLLSRFDHVDGKGLFGLAGFIELDERTPEQFAERILERLARNEGKPKDHYTGPAAADPHRSKTSIPNNLPRLPYFFGRDADLKRVAAALAPDARGWGALIDGPGGIGKTALAIRAAELVPRDRFRRIIFLSAKERELTADGQRSLGTFVLPTALEMLNAIARELEEPSLTKAPESERPELVLRALRERSVLLVLDNLETLPAPDRDQLFAFLNRLPRDTSAIVTSRRRADAGAVSVRLDRLDWIAASALMTELAKTFHHLAQVSDKDRRSLHEQTGGNPLLIRWVAGQLGRGRCLTVTSALDLLRSPEAGNNPLEFVFGDLLDTFTGAETKVLAALTHFTLPIDVSHVAELSAINEESAQGALADLSSRALVLPDVEERHFLVVPLVADFLRKKKPEAVGETGDRLEKRAYALVVENGYQQHDRFPVLDAEWPTVAAALPRFLAGPNDRLQRVCNALTFFLEFTGRWDEWLALSRAAERRAVADGDFLYAGWRACHAGMVHHLRHQSAEVRTWADAAEAHWREAQAGARERALAILMRGHGHYLAKDYPAAIAAYRESLDLHRSLERESMDVALSLNVLANAECDSGDFDAADRDYREALRIAKVLDYGQGVATYTGNLAAMALDRQDWFSAEAFAREALPLSEKIGRLELIALDCRRLALALVRQDRKAEALPYAERAVDILIRLGSPDLDWARKILAECES